MNGIDKYMIPLDNIRSAGVSDVILEILLALLIGLVTAVAAGGATSTFSDKAATAVAVTVGIITMVLTFCWMFQDGCIKSIDTSKINNEYGITATSIHDEVDAVRSSSSAPCPCITATSMGDAVAGQDDIESHRLSYLHDGALINGILIIKDNAVGLFACTGDKLTPVKPQTVSAAALAASTSGDEKTTTSKPRKTTRSRTGCYVKSYNKDGSVKELAGDCPATPTH